MKNNYKFLVFSLLACLSFFQTFAQDEAKLTLITNVNVWDGNSEETIQADVLIEGNKFKKIEANISAAEGATIIDG